MKFHEPIGILIIISLVSVAFAINLFEVMSNSNPSYFTYIAFGILTFIISIISMLILITILFWISVFLSLLFKKKVLLLMDKPYYYMSCIARLMQYEKIRPLNYKNSEMDKIIALLKELGYEFKFNKFDVYNEYDNIEITDDELIAISDLENGTYSITQKITTKKELIEALPLPLPLSFDEVTLLLKELGSKKNEQ